MAIFAPRKISFLAAGTLSMNHAVENDPYFDNEKSVQQEDHQLIHNRSRSFFQTLLPFLYLPVLVEFVTKVKLQQLKVLLKVVAETFGVLEANKA